MRVGDFRVIVPGVGLIAELSGILRVFREGHSVLAEAFSGSVDFFLVAVELFFQPRCSHLQIGLPFLHGLDLLNFLQLLRVHILDFFSHLPHLLL